MSVIRSVPSLPMSTTTRPLPSISIPQSVMRSLLLLLLAFFVLSPAAGRSAEPRRSCWPKACGDLNITYPFWLEEPGGEPPCGPPSFQLKCNRSGAFLSKSIYQAYRVVAIFADSNSFHVVDDNLPLDTGCPGPTFNISLGIGLGPFLISRNNAQLLFLANCTEPPSPVPPGFRPLPCDNRSFVRIGLGDGRDFSGQRVQGGIPPGCAFTVVPILAAPDANGENYTASMRNGFLLEWALVSGDCPECMASGGECVYGDNGQGFSCNCSGSLHPEK